MADDKEEVITVPGKDPDESTNILIEVGKKIFLNSIDNGRDFNKSMVHVSAASIPIYMVFLTQETSQNATHSYSLSFPIILVLATPAILFLAAILSFSWGYYPRSYEMEISNPRSIENVHVSLLRYRYSWAKVGMVFFSLGIVTGIVAILLRAGII